MLNIIEPNNAAKNPATIKPETMVEASQNKRALMTKVNSPKVSILIGISKSSNIGRIKMFIRPMTNAAPKADINPVKLIPGTIQAIKSNARAKSTHLISIFNILSLHVFEVRLNIHQ